MGRVMSADLILTGCRFPLGRLADDAIAVRCGRIATVGPAREVKLHAGDDTVTVDLGGRPVIPGFIDAHAHFLQTGLDLTFHVPLATARSLGDALERLTQAAKERPGQWVIARGWDESGWPEKRFIERGDLDRAVPRQPACAVRVDGHMVACNTPALARCTLPESEQVDRERGHLFEDAAWAFLRSIRLEDEDLVEAVAEASRHAASLGITAVAEMGLGTNLPAYQTALRRGLLQTRTFAYLPLVAADHARELGLKRGFGSELLSITGVKAFLDGSVGAWTAALDAPYEGDRGRGELTMDLDVLAHAWRDVARCGLQMAVHAIGERAIALALQAAEEVGVGPEDRGRIEHLELATAEQLDAMARMGLVASMQPNFVGNWSGPGRMYETRLGRARDARIDPHAWVLARGIPLAFGSDGMPMGPLYGIGSVLSPPHESQRMSAPDALRAYTEGAAYALFAERELGVLAPGAWADLVALSADPGSAPLSEVRVDMTWLAGRKIYTRT